MGRDIFTTKHAVAVYDAADRGPRPPPGPATSSLSTQPVFSANDPNSLEGRREASLSLTGVAGDIGQFEAFIEDQTTMKTLFLKVGASIARGRIKDIAFDHIDYEHGGYVQRVLVGQNLLGQLAAASAPVGPSPTVGVGGPSAGVAAPAPGSPPAASPAADGDDAAQWRACGRAGRPRTEGGDRRTRPASPGKLFFADHGANRYDPRRRRQPRQSNDNCIDSVITTNRHRLNRPRIANVDARRRSRAEPSLEHPEFRPAQSKR